MFDFIWRRLTKWQSRKTPIKRRPNRTRLGLEMLESRVTPTATITLANTTLTITTATADSFTVANAGASTVFPEFTIVDTTTNQSYTSSTPVTAMIFKLGNGANSLALNGTSALPIDLTGPTTTNKLGQWLQTTAGPDLTITGTGGNKTITASDVFLSHTTASLSMSLTGNGTENTTFTDSNFTGTAVVSHPNVGNTNFTINTSNNNTNALNTWGSLSITNGTGTDTNAITDTDFSGSVAIANGAGAAGATGQRGGSYTTFADGNNVNLLTIGGNLSITNATTVNAGNTDTEVQDYNVHGNVVLGAGSGYANQNSIVGLEDNQTVAGSAVPIIGGSVTFTGDPVVNSTLTVAIGTGTSGTGDFPLIIGNGVDATVTGAGSPTVYLNDLTVTGASNISLGATTINDTVTVQESNGVPTSYGPLTISALGSVNGTNDVELQTSSVTDPAVLNVAGALTVNLGAGTDDLNAGSEGATPSNVNVTGTFAVNAAVAGSHAITINALEDTFGGLNWTLSGKGTEVTTFTDTNMTGIGVINTTKLTGAAGTTGVSASPTTTFTINASANNNYALNAGIDPLNTWGSLSITNGTGADVNVVTDTDFTGSVTINNGAGATGDTTGVGGVWGGSQTNFNDAMNTNLLFIHGSFSVTTTTGPSSTKIFDYNIRGNVTLGAGAGLSTQQTDSLIGLNNNQTNVGEGIPVIGGSVTITGNPGNPSNLSPGLDIFIGTNQAGTANNPLIINGNLTITTAGTGEADINLNDLSVTGATAITLGKTNSNDVVQVQSDPTFTSTYGAFTFNTSGTGISTLNLQDAAGNLVITGSLVVNEKLSTAANIVDLAADSSNTTGVTNALLDLYGLNTFTFGSMSSTVYGGTLVTNLGTNVFCINLPTFTF